MQSCPSLVASRERVGQPLLENEGVNPKAQVQTANLGHLPRTNISIEGFDQGSANQLGAQGCVAECWTTI